MYVARLKLLDPRKGQVAESYAYAPFDLRWNQGTVHRGLSEAQAIELKKLRQPGKGKTELLDVCTEEEYDNLLTAQAAERLGLPMPIAARVLPVVAPPPPAAPAPVPVETIDHTDVGGVRVQHTQAPPPPPPAPQAAPTKGPKQKGGGR